MTDGETMEEVENDKSGKNNSNQSDTAYVEDENVSLPESFSENDYIRSFSLVTNNLVLSYSLINLIQYDSYSLYYIVKI